MQGILFGLNCEVIKMTQFIQIFKRTKFLTCRTHLSPTFRNFLTGLNHYQKKNELQTLDPIELATGMYKRDILDRLGEQNDPYSVKTLARGVGTKENPNMIPSAFESRMVGCICEEDADSIVWMWLHKGEAKRCQCGFYFQLFYEPPFSEENDIKL